MAAHNVSQEKRDKRGRWIAGGAIGGAAVAGAAVMSPKIIRKTKRSVKHAVKAAKENREKAHFDKSFENISKHYNQSIIDKAKGIKSSKIDLTNSSQLSKLKKKIKAAATNVFIAKESFKKGVQVGKKVQKVVGKIPTKKQAKVKKLINNIRYLVQHYTTDKHAAKVTKRSFKFGVKMGRKIQKLERFSLLKKALNLAFDESEHPRGMPGNKGEFAPKGKGNSGGTPRQRNKAGRIRFAPKKGEKSIHEAYSRKIQERKLERFKKKLDKKALTPGQKERRINKYLKEAKELNEEAKESNSLGSTAKSTAAGIALERAYYKFADRKKAAEFINSKKIKRVGLAKKLKRVRAKIPNRLATRGKLIKRQLRVGRVAIKKTPILGKVVRALTKVGKFGVSLAVRSAPYLAGAAATIGEVVGSLSTGGLLAVGTIAAACAYGAYKYYRYKSDKKKHEKVKAIITKYSQRKNQPSFA